MAVENVTDLLGFDIQFSWNTTYIKYTTHTQTSTVESYPSPYAGIIHDPPLRLAEVVDPAPGSYWAALATLGGSGFDGGGTVFVMAFRVVYQPEPGEGELNTRLDIQSANLASSGGSIPHDVFDGTVGMHARLKCDLNEDGVVNIYDIVLAAEAYGSKPCDPNWNPRADLAPQWELIDIYDLVTLAANYGNS